MKTPSGRVVREEAHVNDRPAVAWAEHGSRPRGCFAYEIERVLSCLVRKFGHEANRMRAESGCVQGAKKLNDPLFHERAGMPKRGVQSARPTWRLSKGQASPFGSRRKVVSVRFPEAHAYSAFG